MPLADFRDRVKKIGPGQVSKNDRSGRFFSGRLGRGQELVEFAIVVPLLVLILFGVLDLGRAFHAAIVITNAARQGARYAVSFGFTLNPDDTIIVNTGEIQDFTVREAQSSGITLTTGDVVVSSDAGGYGRGKPVRVTVTYTVDLVMDFVLPADSLTLIRSVEMMVP